MILLCQVISQEQVMTGSCDFMSSNPLRYVIILSSLVAIGSAVLEILSF